MIFSENRFPLFRIMLKSAKNQRGAFLTVPTALDAVPAHHTFVATEIHRFRTPYRNFYKAAAVAKLGPTSSPFSCLFSCLAPRSQAVWPEMYRLPGPSSR